MILFEVVFCFIIFIVETLSVPLCPSFCYCNVNFIDCKFNKLNSLPFNLDTNISSLDLSHNEFKEFPINLQEFHQLKYLNISFNQISVLDYTVFDGLYNLEHLDLTHNKFTDWMDIKTQSFIILKNLKFLDFSHNSLRNIPLHHNPLKIPSLEILKLNNCTINNLNSDIFNKLPNLKELHINQNPIVFINNSFTSYSVKFIDLSQCNIRYIAQFAFNNLTTLETIWLYKNRYFKNFSCSSNSLLFIDLSDCNLEFVPNSYLNNVYMGNFHGNHFRILTNNSFVNFNNLKHLDLSYNALSYIEKYTFHKLDNIEYIDLSFNTLSHIDNHLFYNNYQLKILNLSHNYFNKIEHLKSQSIEILDLSTCEIQEIDRKSLIDMPSLRELYLKKNIISILPNHLLSTSLIVLDLSMCRINFINNRTFSLILTLRNLNLSGNRLTTLNPNAILQVTYLDIQDNPWRCDCLILNHLYLWLLQTGKRIDKLTCQSPEKYEGMLWKDVCKSEWYPNINHRDKAWWYSIGIIITMLILLVFIVIIRRIYKLKEKRIRQENEARIEEERESLRRMHLRQLEVREEISRNAPDPRESQRPPSYNEALLMPILDSSHPSLAGSLHSIGSSKHGSSLDVSKKNKIRRKRKKRKSNFNEGQRTSQAIPDTDTSDPAEPQPRSTLESDF